VVSAMRYGGARTELVGFSVPEPDEPIVVEAKWSGAAGKKRDRKVFFFGYVAAGMGVAGLFVLAALTLYSRRASREYSGMTDVIENGFSEASTVE